MARGRTPTHDYDAIFRHLVETGCSKADAARHFGVTPSTVRVACKRESEQPGGGRLAAYVKGEQHEYQTGRRKPRPPSAPSKPPVTSTPKPRPKAAPPAPEQTAIVASDPATAARFDGVPQRGEDREPPGTRPVDMGPLEFQRWLLGEALVGLEDANPGSIAYCTSIRQVQVVRERVDELAEIERAKKEANPADLTPEEWIARVEEDAQAATEGELEVYVRRWLQLKKYRLTVGAGGVLALERAASA